MAIDPNLTMDQKKGLRQRLSTIASNAGGAIADQFTDPHSPIRQIGNAVAGFGVGHPTMFLDRPASADAHAAGTAPTATVAPASTAPALKALPNGLRRFEMDPGNEATVYVGRGKHGEPFFTDSPNGITTRENLAGGLRRGSDLYAHTTGPNAGFEYAPNTLQRGGFTAIDKNTGKPFTAPGIDVDKAILSANDPRQLQTYEDQLAGAAGTYADPETQLSDRILANRLQSHMQDGLRRGGSASGPSALTPAQQVAMAKLHETAAYHQGVLSNQNEGLKQRGTEAAAKAQRAAFQDFTAQIAAIKDPNELASFMFSQVPDQPSKEWKDSPIGRQVLSYLRTTVGAAAGGSSSGASLAGLKFQPNVYDNFSISRPSAVTGTDNSARIGFLPYLAGGWMTPTDQAEGAPTGGFNRERFPEPFYSKDANMKLRGLRKLLRSDQPATNK